VRALHWQAAEGGSGGGGASASASSSDSSGSNTPRHMVAAAAAAAAAEERPLRTCAGGAPRARGGSGARAPAPAPAPPPYLAPHLTRCMRACVEALAIARVLERLRRREVTFRTAELFEGMYAECGHRLRVPSLWPHCRLPAGEVEEMLHRQLPSLMASKGRERQVPGEALWAFPGLDKGAGKGGGGLGGGAGGAGAGAGGGGGASGGGGGSGGALAPSAAAAAFSTPSAAAAALAALGSGGRDDGASESGLNLALISIYAASASLLCGASDANPNVLLWAPPLEEGSGASSSSASSSASASSASAAASAAPATPSAKRAGILVYCRAASAPPTHATAPWVSAAFQWFRTLAVTHEFCDPVRRKASLGDAAVLRRLLAPGDASSSAAVGGVWGDWGMREGSGSGGGGGGGGPPPGRFRAPPPAPACAACGSREGQVAADGKAVALLVCGGCARAAFCSSACQRAFWLQQHQHECAWAAPGGEGAGALALAQ
jgi:uncharacterized membrane protein YgcG